MNVTVKRIVFVFASGIFITGLGAFSAAGSEQPVPTPTTYQSETAQRKPVESEAKVIAEPVRKEQAKLVKVKRGDTLAKIATREETTVRRIFNANDELDHPDAIEPGDELVIPPEDAELPDRYSKHLEELAAEKAAQEKAAALKRQKEREALQRQQAVEASVAPEVSTPAPKPAAASAGVWDDLAACESGGNWSINTGNGYYGGLQFSLSSWQAVGGSGYPHQASKAEQIRRGEILQDRQGWGAWPSCAAKLGLY